MPGLKIQVVCLIRKSTIIWPSSQKGLKMEKIEMKEYWMQW